MIEKLGALSSSKLHVATLNENLESIFWTHVNMDPLDFHFFIYDWKFKRGQTKIFMALDEANAAAGLMVFYLDSIVLVRGSREAAQLLLDHVDAEKVMLQAPLDCKDIVVKRFPVAKQKGTVILMFLKKGEEHLRVTIEPEKLSVSDAGEIATLMHVAYPEFWSDITAESIEESFDEAVWFGVRHDGKLVAFGKAIVGSYAGHVAWIATYEEYRNRGYASSILSALIKVLLEYSDTAIIYVLGDNAPAMHVYSKIGFKHYKSYFYVKLSSGEQ